MKLKPSQFVFVCDSSSVFSASKLEEIFVLSSLAPKRGLCKSSFFFCRLAFRKSWFVVQRDGKIVYCVIKPGRGAKARNGECCK